MASQIFISYSSIKDLNGTVSEFHKNLQNEIQVNTNPSVTVFLDKEGIRTGNSWKKSIFDALDECIVFVILLSPSWLHSEWCKKEYLYFKASLAEGKRKKIIPLRWADTTSADANSPEEQEIIEELDEIQQVNWLPLRYKIDYKKSEPLREAVGDLGATIAGFIKGFTLIIKYPYRFEEQVKKDEARPSILGKRISQATILTNFIPAWLVHEKEFDAIGANLSRDELKKIKDSLPSFISTSIYDQFSAEFFKTHYDALPEVEARLADFRLKIQDFNKKLNKVISKDAEVIKKRWRNSLKKELSLLQIAAVQIQDAAKKIFDESIAALSQKL